MSETRLIYGARVWWLKATHGLPLDITLGMFAERGVYPTWVELFQAALQDGVNYRRFQDDILGIVADVYEKDVSTYIKERLPQAAELALLRFNRGWRVNGDDNTVVLVKMRNDIQVGMIAEDCSLHIGEVLKCDPVSGDVTIRSMFDGVERNCDLYHCGVVAQTPENVELKTKLWNEGGIEALVKRYDEQVEEVFTSSHKQTPEPKPYGLSDQPSKHEQPLSKT